MVLGGCASSAYAPVSDRSLDRARPAVKVQRAAPSPHRSASGYYQVQPGDTLYSIAWRFGKDYRAMARANGIASDYRIYPGQRLRLAEAPVAAKPVAKPKPTTASKPRREAKSAAQSTSKPATATPARSRSSAPQTVPAAANQPVRWRWPASGKVLRQYQARGKINKGIDLAGNPGDPVLSAAAGRVVYAGSGLLGYGNLIIINHNEQYLSAYAHNRRLLVKENQAVKAGQKIAEIGNSGATRTMLHFEIRKDGKPVNPLHYLPKR